MEKILFGDNQFFAVNHISDEKSRAQSIKFKTDDAIIKTLDDARNEGIGTVSTIKNQYFIFKDSSVVIRHVKIEILFTLYYQF